MYGSMQYLSSMFPKPNYKQIINDQSSSCWLLMSNFKCNTCQLLVLPDLEQLDQQPESNFLQVLQNKRIGGVPGRIPSDDQVSRSF
jgi:hypothetical protein